MFRADLHCHTTMSDGTVSPEALLVEAKKISLGGICITDHDTVAAYTPSIVTLAKQLGLRLGCGVEFSSVFEKTSVHVLAYDIDLHAEGATQLCERHRFLRKERNLEILEKLSRHGMPIFKEELDQLPSQVIGRPHIAHLMIKKGYVLSLQEAFQRYLGEKKSCYSPEKGVGLEETLSIIRKNGAKSFLAHPHLLEGRGKVNRILGLPFDGMECYYGRLGAHVEQRWVKIAQQKGWLISGGSDFHGTIKPHISLGASWVDEKTFEQIFSRPLA